MPPIRSCRRFLLQQLCGRHKGGALRRPGVGMWPVERLEPRWNLSGVPTADWSMITDNGPSSNRVDIVFLGDGYTAAEIDTVYFSNIDVMLQYLFNQDQDPFPRYRNFFNVTRIDVISAESGVDEPMTGIVRDSALNGTYRGDGVTDRLAVVDLGLANQYYFQLPFTADIPVVTLNSSTYGGSGGSLSVYAGNNPSSADVALHEMGHSFAHLADEYDYGGPTHYSGSEPSEPNVTLSATGDKWAEWLGYVDGELGVIGAYEGGKYSQTGIYRPTQTSKMEALNEPFNAIAREAFIQRIYSLVRPIDAALAADETIDSSATLWADIVDPNVIQVKWFVDDVLVPGATGTYFVPADFGFGTGTHTVTMEAYDDTDWVRRGTDVLHEEREWTISDSVTTSGLVFGGIVGDIELTEGGAQRQYSLKLSAAPTQTVTISLNGNGEVHVSPATMTFTPGDWNMPQTITLSAVTDDVIDGDDVGEVTYSIDTLDAVYADLVLPRTRAVIRDSTAPARPNRSPQITSYEFEVSPTATNGAYVGTLAAFDPDAGQALTWEIVSGNESGLVSLAASTGVLSLADSSQLDPGSEVMLQVRVTDSGNPRLSDTSFIFLLFQTPSSDSEAYVSLNETERSYDTLGSPLEIASTGTVQLIGGSGSLQGTVLTVRSAGKKSGKDRLVVSPSNGVGSQVTVVGQQVSFEGTQIGTILAGKPKAGLRVQFNSQADIVSVQAVLRRISFQTTAKKRAPRNLQLSLDNYDGQPGGYSEVQVFMEFA